MKWFHLLLFIAIAAPPLRIFAHPVEAHPLDEQLQSLVGRDTVTVVHTWAPWCPNCHVEFRENQWAKFIEGHPEVTFVFVEIWNDGADSEAVLARYGIGGQPNFHRLVDPNPRRGAEKSSHLLGQPLTWVPSTWVYQRGRVRFALLYGEVRFEMLRQMIADTTASWRH